MENAAGDEIRPRGRLDDVAAEDSSVAEGQVQGGGGGRGAKRRWGGGRGGTVWLALGPDADREDKEEDREAVRPAPKPPQSWAAFGSKFGVRADTSPDAPARWSPSFVRWDKIGLGWSVCASPLEVP